MAALDISSTEKDLVDLLETYLEQAFLSGVTSNSTEIIAALDGYDQAQYQKIGGYPLDVRDKVKASFKSTVAAYLKAMNAGTWQSLTPDGTWAAVGGDYSTPGYFRDVFGWVSLKGAVSGGTESQTILTLPSQIYPSKVKTLTAYAVVAGNPVTVPITINLGGTVVTPATPAGAYTFLSLDGIRYKISE